MPVINLFRSSALGTGNRRRKEDIVNDPAGFAALERFNYEPVGNLRFINWSGDFVPETTTLAAERFLSPARLPARPRKPFYSLGGKVAHGARSTSAGRPSHALRAP